jgi:hypothetical protein
MTVLDPPNEIDSKALVTPLEVPLQLPQRRYGRHYRLDVLSPASIRLVEKCPEQFRRRYLLGEREPSNLSMTRGSVVGDALAHFFAGQIKGERMSRSDLDDLVISLFAEKIAEAVLTDEDDPDLARAQCRAGAADYLEEIAPSVEPISVERRASFRFLEEQEWTFVCYFDLECAGQVPDLKFGEHRVDKARASKDLQATAYSYLRWAEGSEAEFVFHSGLLERPEDEPRWAVVPAPRGVGHFRGFEQRVARAARLIAHLDQTEPGEWPMSSEWGWWCAPREGTRGCPYWNRCPVGGAAPAIAHWQPGD